METRDLLLECIKIAFRTGYTEHAKEIGTVSTFLKSRIASYNYTEDDARYYRVNEIIKVNYKRHGEKKSA